ncbi:hypothetical protein AeMF1_007340 [Aphanomyces euteiches]|nr:hypothetical protein AeMF1_007340 [Aphanomyces euteiches]
MSDGKLIFIPKGTTVIVSLVAQHRDPKYGSESHELIPVFPRRQGDLSSGQGVAQWSRRESSGDGMTKMKCNKEVSHVWDVNKVIHVLAPHVAKVAKGSASSHADTSVSVLAPASSTTRGQYPLAVTRGTERSPVQSLSAPSNLVRKTSERAAFLMPAPKTWMKRQWLPWWLDNFHRFDTNRDGVLQKKEFFEALTGLGLNYSPELLEKIMGAVDLDGGNTIDYKEFLAAFTQSVLQQVSNMFYQHRIHIRAVFRIFDSDNSGQISMEEFRAGISTFNAIMDNPLTEDQIDALLAHLDSDGDGKISYKEFLEGFQVVDVRLQE